MAQVTIVIPDAVLPRVLDAFARQFRYDAAALPGETKAQFARRQIQELVRAVVRDAEGAAAVEAARAAAIAKADSEITLS